MAKSAKAVSTPIPKNGIGVFETVQWECKGSVVKHAISCYIENEFFSGTFVFDVNEDYTPKWYKELGSVPEQDHVAAMEAAGFEVQDA